MTKPFLKWAGGKRQLISHLLSMRPGRYGRYFEPFLGGGALFFALQPKDAVLGDLNAELINAYETVRDHVGALVRLLRSHKHSESDFYAVRGLSPLDLDPVARAARTIYLNRTCFNGLYRLNGSGVFNVPFGRHANPKICDEDTLRACSEILRGVELRAGDFRDSLQGARKGDFVYLDPPYVPLSRTSSFTSYAATGFSSEEQLRLRNLFVELDRAGVFLMLSNSDCAEVRELYAGFPMVSVRARRSINSVASKRGCVGELIVHNGLPGEVPMDPH